MAEPSRESKTYVSLRATHHIVGCLNGSNVKIIFFKDIVKGLKNYANLHSIKDYNIFIPPETPDECLSTFNHNDKPSSSITYYSNKGLITLTKENRFDTSMPPLNFLIFRDKTYVIKTISEQKKCSNCGTYFTASHNCSHRKSVFYNLVINHSTREFWEPIRFTPLGAIPNTKRLFIIYDIETFTLHTAYGKQLVPYLIAIKFQGSKKLVKIASNIAKQSNFDIRNECFYMLDKTSKSIGKSFKELRNKIQLAAALKIWRNFKTENNLDENITFEEINKLMSKGLLDTSKEPKFIEIIVIGHNITGFDEIVLATHVLDGSSISTELPMFKMTRNFMPRAGKILFNDVTLGLPNPHYEKKPSKATIERWKTGSLHFMDMKYQGVKLMVRDTFLMTHSSLRNAATAYQLEASKGYCPYTAVNEFLMTGTYDKDEIGFPHRKYWSSEQEYLENKKPNYDLIQEAIDYCIEDVKVTAKLVSKLLQGYQKFCETEIRLNCDFNVFQRPTISSNTHAIFKQIYYKNNNPTCSFMPNIVAPSTVMYDFVRQSIRGGRCYPTFIGIYNEPIYVYDICGMYASALTHPLPHGLPQDPLSSSIAIMKFQSALDSKQKISYFDSEIKPMIVSADCNPPNIEMLDVLPPICSRKGGRLCWTNEPLRGEVMTTIDLITLHNRGWKCKILTNTHYVVWPEWKCICKEYVSLNIKAKEKADKEKNMTQRNISKLLSNALYGSFATKLDNKKVIFESDIENDPETSKNITLGKSTITAKTTIISKSLPERENNFKNTFNLPGSGVTDEYNNNKFLTKTDAFIGQNNHVTFNITHLENSCDDLILAVVEDCGEWIENKRYPTQIATFVLAWTRAFTSEWCDILYSNDRGKNFTERTIKSIYGDTDSLFLTLEGHNIMNIKGKHRLKKYSNKLVFDEKNPELTWLVECETICPHCFKDAYCSESVYLAPKLYCLKDIVCDSCNKISEGKLRAKGHAKECLNYEVLKQCFTNYDLLGEDQTKTQRTSIKRTMTVGNKTFNPFTAVEKTLTRILRPWADMTLRMGDRHLQGYLLFPYDKKHPNPRVKEVLTSNPFWEDT
uniref:DNA polymerase n=1 Tax=Zoothera dauma adenovirus TaxID=3073259 RepID=A0AA51NPD4_9ADEN|nr:DNA polymerase [Zoothera dauma adenovirus]